MAPNMIVGLVWQRSQVQEGLDVDVDPWREASLADRQLENSLSGRDDAPS